MPSNLSYSSPNQPHPPAPQPTWSIKRHRPQTPTSSPNSYEPQTSPLSRPLRQSTHSFIPFSRSSLGAPGLITRVNPSFISYLCSTFTLTPIAHPNLPPLSDLQSHKLRQLTLLSLSASPSNLTYPHLLTTLSLPTVRALEDLVISTIYSGLLTAKLNTQTQRVDVSSVSPLRDLRPGSIPALNSALGAWEVRCIAVLDDLENQIKEIKQKALERRKRELRDDGAVEKLVQEAKMGAMRFQDDRGKVLGGKRGAGEVAGPMIGASGNDEMDLDDGEMGMGMSRGAKRGGSGGGIKGTAKRFMG